jgi:hypothetical protein
MMRLTPVVTGVVAGAVDGIIVQNDATNTATRDTWLKRYSTWYEAALLLGGIVADQMRMLSTNITEPMMIAGGALLGKTVVEANIKVSGVTAYAVPHYAVPMARPAAYGAVNKQPTMSLI